MTGYIENMRKIVGKERLITVGAGIFIYKENRILLQKRRDNGCWGMHGGSVEVGETVENAAKRELYEETGLVANSLELLGIFSGEKMLYTYPNGDQVYIIGIVYICDDFSGEFIKETNETLDLKWFDIDSLPDKIQPGDIEPLKCCVRRINQIIAK